ncbi:MarR family winged helix-turn-helix transcriptional regulator [Streptomyces sp. NBC_00525]|uniref:MarR family winged helix-turn-helix transcriptional regulator n=1 Tax=Streptomyces sp. NBC_00525 TaxID=2903660 RepID=UPI002E810C0E|nr:MarR family transcriptional regulator [Streptomyces sp. NBC_00525]WUC93342.1 MarR family transcriptional regulator [Streptomyces sp. NBC_00525]
MAEAPGGHAGAHPGGEGPGGEGRGFELPLLLFAGFRSVIDALHRELAEEGHPDMRPAYGYALQAVGLRGATASEIGRRLGVSKQAAGKTVDRLEGLGYVERADDPDDGRRKLVRLTARGTDVLARSAAGFDRLRAEWVLALGADRVRALEDDLRTMAPDGAFRLDVASWFNG